MTRVVVQQTARLQVLQQPDRRQIHFRRMLRVIVENIAVRVPRVGILVADAAGEDLNEADAVLDQPPRHEALAAIWLGDRIVEPVELLGGLRLAVEVDRAGRAALHAIRELIGRDARSELRYCPGTSACPSRSASRARRAARADRPASSPQAASGRQSDRRSSGTTCLETRRA